MERTERVVMAGVSKGRNVILNVNKKTDSFLTFTEATIMALISALSVSQLS